MTCVYRIPYWKRAFFAAALLFSDCPVATAQSPMPLDTLIVRVPVLMRSDETAARQSIDELARRAPKEGHRHGVIQSVFYQAWLSYRHDPADLAIRRIDSALQHLEGIQQDTALVKFYILKGQCYVKKTQFGPALESFGKAVKVAEARGDMASRISTMISIGWAYMEDGKPAEAIRFFEEVLRLQPAADYPHRALLLCNMAASYNTLGKFRQAEHFASKGVATARARGSNVDLANGLNILARSLYQQGKLEAAIINLKEAAVVREKVADPSMLASDYLELADLYTKNGQPAQAITWARKAEVISSRQANHLKLGAAYQALSAAYEAVGDHRSAVHYLQKLLAQKDSLADDHYNQAFARMQVQFETQKKTAENLQLKKANLEARLRNAHQQRWLLGLSAGVVLLLASGVYSSKLMKSRYKTRLALAQLQEQKERTLAVMETEEKERRRIAGDLHDGVGQTLAAAALQLTKARQGQLPLDKVDELLHQACSEVRTLSHQVTPELLLHYGLVKAIEQAVDRLNEANDGTSFTLYTHVEEPLDHELAQLTLYRCFQEISNNILRHARATGVTVQLTLERDEAELMVEDNGVGFDPGSAAYGLGLKNMQSRLAPFEGVLEVDSTLGKGTTITVRLLRPLPDTIKTA
jgi:two-component system, NarL family, sensor kinase